MSARADGKIEQDRRKTVQPDATLMPDAGGRIRSGTDTKPKHQPADAKEKEAKEAKKERKADKRRTMQPGAAPLPAPSAAPATPDASSAGRSPRSEISDDSKLSRRRSLMVRVPVPGGILANRSAHRCSRLSECLIRT
jgi:hypothetical protein